MGTNAVITTGASRHSFVRSPQVKSEECMGMLRLILIIIISTTCLMEEDVTDVSSHTNHHSAQRPREGKQFVGLGWRLMEASRNNLENHREFGRQNVEAMIEARSKFWNRINEAMERDQLVTADSRTALANRFQRVRNMMHVAQQRDEQRRQQSMAAIHHMMSSVGNRYRRAQDTGTKLSNAFNPLTYINYWMNYT